MAKIRYDTYNRFHTTLKDGDVWALDDDAAAALDTFVELSTVRHHDHDIECLRCGEWDGHKKGRPAALVEQALKEDADGLPKPTGGA